MSSLRIVLAQVNPLVGDIAGNTDQVIEAVRKAETEQSADLVVFPELNLMGYPAEDLLLRASVAPRIEQAQQRLLDAGFSATVVVGYPELVATPEGQPQFYSTVAVIQAGAVVATCRKRQLSRARAFDEALYFKAGEGAPCMVNVRGYAVAALTAADLPLAERQVAGAELVVAVTAAPFTMGQREPRLALLRQTVAGASLPLVYLNQVGGQDELVFDGASLALDTRGEVCLQAPAFEEGLYLLELRRAEGGAELHSPTRHEFPAELASIYQALVLGLRDYVTKNGFKGVILGLSGGIDSALTLAIAVDALGSERVEAVMMPFRYTSEMSRDDAAAQARTLGVHYRSIDIEGMYGAIIEALKDEFAGLPVDSTEENIQARCRGNLLMAISNKKGYLVLTTGNKSESAVGYSTLYGDMAGGFAVLKDVFKSHVFALARYRNTISPAIPERVITRPPSAELAPDQKDEDSLPAYDILDPILTAYIEDGASADDIVAQGYAREVVERVLRLVDRNEYKRHQAPPGACVSRCSFSGGRRLPMTSGWRWDV